LFYLFGSLPFIYLCAFTNYPRRKKKIPERERERREQSSQGITKEGGRGTSSTYIGLAVKRDLKWSVGSQQREEKRKLHDSNDKNKIDRDGAGCCCWSSSR
jgi:hypothetical protein